MFKLHKERGQCFLEVDAAMNIGNNEKTLFSYSQTFWNDDSAVGCDAGSPGQGVCDGRLAGEHGGVDQRRSRPAQKHRYVGGGLLLQGDENDIKARPGPLIGPLFVQTRPKRLVAWLRRV